MKNKEKFTDEKEAKEAHKKWCKDMAETGWMCTQECNLCFEAWMDKEAEENGDEESKDSDDVSFQHLLCEMENERWLQEDIEELCDGK